MLVLCHAWGIEHEVKRMALQAGRSPAKQQPERKTSEGAGSREFVVAAGGTSL